MEVGQKVWLSKYALTIGIEEHVVRRVDGRFIDLEDEKYKWVLLVWGRDVHASRGDAVIAAEVARKRKLASLLKQIQKLQGMEF